jgi:hypothetical protein
MQIDKQQIIDFLRARGEDGKATQAGQELPAQVDTDQHMDLLRKIGIDPADLTGGLGNLSRKLGL